MANKKATYEKISPAVGSSISVKHFANECTDKLPFWHFHPEMELVYVNGGSGKRHIGNHLSYFQNGTLVLIGSNLPHCSFSDKIKGIKSQTVVQMKEDFLGELPEKSYLQKLWSLANRGLAFRGNTKRNSGAKIEALTGMDHFDRFVHLMMILKDLALSKEYTILNAEGFALEISPQDNNRINIVYEHVRNNFRRSISLDEIAEKVSMTMPAFCRYFKKITRKTFTRFVNDYRLVHASKLLAEKQTSITEIAFECGFNNFSHFNKLFKAFNGKSPSAYRSEIKSVVS